MIRYLPVLLAASVAFPASAQQTQRPPATLTPAPQSSYDGDWRGTSDNGSCAAPLEISLSIEYGFVEGTAYDTSAKGPVPNPSKSAPPLPTPGLWQLHGTAGNGPSFNLIAVASVRATDRRDSKAVVRRDGGALVYTEETGCRRTARLNKS
jgi:hypothetical protein